MKSLWICFLCLSLSLNATVTTVIEKIKERSATSKSDSLVLLRRGAPLIVHQSEVACGGIDSMEMTKPFIGLAIALLLDEGRLPCLDLAVHTYYPEWNCAPYQSITLHHLLGNTSGLDNDNGYLCCSQEKNGCSRNSDFIAAILNSRLIHCPGTHFSNNSKALLLLIDIVEKASGQKFQDYLYKKLFAPLGIDNVSWNSGGIRDRLPQFHLSAWDLAKVGTLIANNGKWQCKPIISPRRLHEVLTPSQPFNPFFGLQWWLEFYDIAAWWDSDLLEQYCQEGISQKLISKLTALQGRVIHFSGQVYGSHIVKLRGTDLLATFGEEESIAQLIRETHCKGLPLAKFKTGKLKMASAHGREGQHLIIMPDQGLVAVRQRLIDRCPASACEDDFDDLPDLMEEIAKECDCYID